MYVLIYTPTLTFVSQSFQAKDAQNLKNVCAWNVHKFSIVPLWIHSVTYDTYALRHFKTPGQDNKRFVISVF